MNRARSVLKFSSPARALKKLTSQAGTFQLYGDRDNLLKIPPMPPPPLPPESDEPCEPPAGFVGLHLRWGSAFTLRYANGQKVHSIGFSPRQPYCMTNSCNGLVGVYSCDGFWIANPTIPRLAALPQCSPHIRLSSPTGNVLWNSMPNAAIGLADASTGEHKVVRLFGREQAGFRPISLGCEVLSLKKESRHFWKQVDDPPTYAIAMFSMPLVVNGIVYWTVKNAINWKSPKIKSKFRRSVIALCFDLHEEKFSLLHHPEGWAKDQEILVSNLILLEGRPCLVDMHPGTRMTVWNLEDRVSSKWLRRGDFHYRGLCWADMSRKVYYELPSIDNSDQQTLGLLKKETLKMRCYREEAPSMEDITEYYAPYTENNFWPF